MPYAEAFLTNVSFQGRRIEMKLPEGLLELQAPLNEDEKRQQKLEANETRKAGERRRGHNK